MTRVAAVPDCDVLIAGGGLVGLSLALALGDSGLRIAVVDQQQPEPSQLPPDQRHLALAEASCRVLARLGVMSALAGRVEAIRGLHVSSAGEFGAVRWNAAEHGLTRFGMVVPARSLLAALWRQVEQFPSIRILAPASVVQVITTDDGLHADIRAPDALTISARMLVIADGADSRLRTAAGITAQLHDYGTSAICAALASERAHDGVAYERFTRSGPLAMLPQPADRCACIYVVERNRAAELMQASDADFLAQLQSAFGYRLGRLSGLGARMAYPLRRVYASSVLAPRQVLVGNAAQALHPVGAQGFNLGLRDAAVLAQHLRAAHAGGQDPGARAVLEAYANARAADRAATAALSHQLASVTVLRSLPAQALRTLALLAADRAPALIEHLRLAGMGFRAGSAELALAWPTHRSTQETVGS